MLRNMSSTKNINTRDARGQEHAMPASYEGWDD